jgi:hypothetical protein
MANLMRTVLDIQGTHVKEVLDYIGFNPEGKPIAADTPYGAPDLAVLIDFNRVVPMPTTEPSEGWSEWWYDNWNTVPYDGYKEGDIIEVTETKARFIFYTKWAAAYPVVDTLAIHFPLYSFHMQNWETSMETFSDALWKNGFPLLYVPSYSVSFQRDLCSRSYRTYGCIDPATAHTRRYAEMLWWPPLSLA